MGSGAAEQIHFIGAGGGDEQLSIFYTGLEQGIHGGAVAVNAHHIELLLALLQNPGIDVDEGNVVALGAQQAGQRGADLAVAGNDDVHKYTSSLRTILQIILSIP